MAAAADYVEAGLGVKASGCARQGRGSESLRHRIQREGRKALAFLYSNQYLFINIQ